MIPRPWVLRMWLFSAALITLAGCSPSSERAMRYEAERVRWKIDREEERAAALGTSSTQEEISRILGLHEEIEQRFGPTEPPSDVQLKNADAVVRLRIAGASALYRADLETLHFPKADLVERYRTISRVYAFDEELAVRALAGEGKLLEKLGRFDEAQYPYRELVDRYPCFDPSGDQRRTPSFDEEGRLDLEVHALAMAMRWRGQNATAFRDRVLSRTRAYVAEGAETTEGVSMAIRHLARLELVCGNRPEAIAHLRRRIDTMREGEDRHLALIEWAEVVSRGPEGLPVAEAELRSFLGERTQGLLSADARLLLAKMAMQTSRWVDALSWLQELLETRARDIEGLEIEARVLRARCLAEMGRGQDAISGYKFVLENDSEGAWAVLAGREMVIQYQILHVPRRAEEAAAELIRRADSIPDRIGFILPFGWEGVWFAPEELERWKQAVGALRWVAQGPFPESTRQKALEVSDRLERDRVANWELSLGRGGNSQGALPRGESPPLPGVSGDS